MQNKSFFVSKEKNNFIFIVIKNKTNISIDKITYMCYTHHIKKGVYYEIIKVSRSKN